MLFRAELGVGYLDSQATEAAQNVTTAATEDAKDELLEDKSFHTDTDVNRIYRGLIFRKGAQFLQAIF